MTETGEGNRFWKSAPWSALDLTGDRQLTPRNSWEDELMLKSKERRNHTPVTGVYVRLVSFRINYIEVFLILETAFYGDP